MEAIVMLSGGMDSAAVLALAVQKHGAKNVLAVSFNYGQTNRKELDAVLQLVHHYCVALKYFPIDLTKIGGSALTDASIEIPKHEEDLEFSPSKPREQALTYVPMRNTIFLALCAAFAEVFEAKIIYTGFNHIDSGGYPDTTPDYVSAMNTITLGFAKRSILIVAPLIKMTKADIVRKGEELNVPWKKTWSCYKGGDKPCGVCNACVQRAKGFNEAEVKDPLL